MARDHQVFRCSCIERDVLLVSLCGIIYTMVTMDEERGDSNLRPRAICPLPRSLRELADEPCFRSRIQDRGVQGLCGKDRQTVGRKATDVLPSRRIAIDECGGHEPERGQ